MPPRTIRRDLASGEDIHEAIIGLVLSEDITHGRVTGTGRVRRATLACYDQKQIRHHTVEINAPVEILSMYGTAGVRNALPFADVHVVLADDGGNGRGGHILPGATPAEECSIVIEVSR